MLRSVTGLHDISISLCFSDHKLQDIRPNEGSIVQQFNRLSLRLPDRAKQNWQEETQKQRRNTHTHVYNKQITNPMRVTLVTKPYWPVVKRPRIADNNQQSKLTIKATKKCRYPPGFEISKLFLSNFKRGLYMTFTTSRDDFK